MYKLILTDLDGTLLNDEKNVSQEDLAAIHKAIEQGVSVGIASGRSNMSIEVINKRLGIDDFGGYSICYNGGTIIKSDTKEKIIVHYVDSDISKKIASICVKHHSPDCSTMLYKNEKLYVQNITEGTKLYAQRSFLNPVVVSDIIAECDENINKIFVHGDHDILLQIESEIKSKYAGLIPEKFNCFFSEKHIFEFNPPGIDKGSALKELSDYLRIDRSEIIAIGDNFNDTAMLHEAGLGVAVANAPEKVKTYANVVTKSTNNNSAIAEVINKYILEVI